MRVRHTTHVLCMEIGGVFLRGAGVQLRGEGTVLPSS